MIEEQLADFTIIKAQLNCLIALLLQLDFKDSQKTKTEHAIFLKSFGLSYEDIAQILQSFVASITELVGAAKRTKAKQRESKA